MRYFRANNYKKKEKREAGSQWSLAVGEASNISQNKYLIVFGSRGDGER